MVIEEIKGITKFGYPQGALGRKGYRPKAVVIHVMEGTIVGSTAHFLNPKVFTSYNYGVGKKGKVVCWVKDENAAWANGKVQKPLWKGLIPNPKIPGQFINPNLYTISIAREGFNYELYTTEQYNSLLWIIKLMVEKWKIPISRQTIIGHYEIDSIGKPLCPGKINLDYLVKELKKLGSGGGEPLSLL